MSSRRRKPWIFNLRTEALTDPAGACEPTAVKRWSREVYISDSHQVRTAAIRSPVCDVELTHSVGVATLYASIVESSVCNIKT